MQLQYNSPFYMRFESDLRDCSCFYLIWTRDPIIQLHLDGFQHEGFQEIQYHIPRQGYGYGYPIVENLDGGALANLAVVEIPSLLHCN